MTAHARVPVVLDDLASAIDSARAALVVVVVPGAAGDPAAGIVHGALARSGVDIRAVRALRADVHRPGALVARLDTDLVSVVTVVSELQWADDASLRTLVERAGELAATGVDATVFAATVAATVPRFVGIWRGGADRRPLHELHELALRAGLVIEVRPDDVASLIARGVDETRAEASITATGGLPDLLAELDTVGALHGEVATRLSVLDEPTRTVAELIAFGLAPDLLVRVVNRADTAVASLVVEGLVVAGTGGPADLRQLPAMPVGVAAAVRESCPPARRAGIIATLVDHGPAGLHLDLARMLVDLGDRSEGAATVYLDAAAAFLCDDPATALAFVDAAVAAGASDTDTVPLAAAAQLAVGQPIEALRILGRTSAGESPTAQMIRAAAWASLGDLAAAADALAGSTRPALARWAAVGCGRPRPALAAGPVDTDDAATILAETIEAWADRTDASLAAWLGRWPRLANQYRIDPDAHQWPVTPALVAALVAVRLGADDVAGDMTATAVAERSGGHLHQRSHLLLAAWLDARRGRLDAATDAIDAADGAAEPAPHARFVRAATRCAVAVRDAEADDVDSVVDAASAALAAITPSLYDLDLLAEIAAAATRTRSDVGRGGFERIEAMVDALGGPDHLRFDLAWCRLRAALAGDDPELVVAAAHEVLAIEPGRVPHAFAADIRRAASVLATPAAATDVAEVIDVGRSLAAAGAPHEAARVCGVIALWADDDVIARRLLRESRSWRAVRASLRGRSGIDRDIVRLSEQEQRIARMVLDGHTHKQIGATLYVSPKTVEHHVAHIRTKLACSNRAEMMTALRDYLVAV